VRADGYVPESTQILNYPIQSFATADIVPIALVYIHWRVKAAGLRATLVNTVHDSVLTDIHKDDVPEYTEIAVTSFLDCVYAYLDKVYLYDFAHIPLGVGLSVARHWGDGEEQKVSYGKDAVKELLS
jgi:DNA polymerase I-like protein with 3'-5' exonuclease and polymerase domains